MHVRLGSLEHRVVVHQHLVDGAVEEVAQRLHDDVLVGVEQARPLPLLGLGLDALPEPEQGREVRLQNRLRLPERVGAQDNAAPWRHVELGRLLAHGGADLLVLDLARDTARLVERREHQVPAGEADVRRERGPFGAGGVLGDLHQQGVASLQDPVDPGSGLVRRRGSVVRLSDHVMGREHPVPLGAEVHERRVQGRVDVRDDAAVDVASGQTCLGNGELVGVERVSAHDRDAHLFGALRVDQHSPAQASSNRSAPACE